MPVPVVGGSGTGGGLGGGVVQTAAVHGVVLPDDVDGELLPVPAGEAPTVALVRDVAGDADLLSACCHVPLELLPVEASMAPAGVAYRRVSAMKLTASGRTASAPVRAAARHRDRLDGPRSDRGPCARQRPRTGRPAHRPRPPHPRRFRPPRSLTVAYPSSPTSTSPSSPPPTATPFGCAAGAPRPRESGAPQRRLGR